MIDSSVSRPVYVLDDGNKYEYDEKMTGNNGYLVATIDDEQERVSNTQIRMRLPATVHVVNFVVVAEQLKKFLWQNMYAKSIQVWLPLFEEFVQPMLDKINAYEHVIRETNDEGKLRLIKSEKCKETEKVCAYLKEIMKSIAANEKRLLVEWLNSNDLVTEYGKALADIDVMEEKQKRNAQDADTDEAGCNCAIL